MLPTYEHAVTGGHWLDLVAPYVAVRCYAPLCRVSHRFYSQFAPRLWNDPLRAARHLGLQPIDDLRWLGCFYNHSKTVRLVTRRLVTSLDFGVLDVDAPALTAGAHDKTFTDLLRQAPLAFPAVRCIILCGKSSYEPMELGRVGPLEPFLDDSSASMPLMLDVSGGGLPLPSTFFLKSYWRQLAYLDMSDLPGSLQGLVKTGTFDHDILPNLRVLKLRGRGLTAASMAPIAVFAENRLWSLDLSRNKLNDFLVRCLLVSCFGKYDLTDDLTADGCRAAVEGRLLDCKTVSGAALPPDWHGWLSYIDESPESIAFAHPDRYLADAPVYDAHRPSRLAGRERLKSDSVRPIQAVLAGGLGRPIPAWPDARASDVCVLPPSLTHLHLSDNANITIEGIEALFRRSRGHIRHFDCASPPRLGPGSPLAGILGRSHLFRPVFAANLQSLRIHHSLVTQVPAWIDVDGDHPAGRALAALDYAETVMRQRVELAYPLAFVPDMNPRLQSLVLTGVPRLSSGPLIDRLLQFLTAVADQLAAIQSAEASRSRRSPTLLRGLRHVGFEFDPWPRVSDGDEAACVLAAMDAGALLESSGADDYSFFDKQPAKPQRQVSVRPVAAGSDSVHAPAAAAAAPPEQESRLAHYPLSAADDEYVSETVSLEELDDGQPQTVAVWVGSGFASRHTRAVAAYMANLSRPQLRTNIRPATPDQVRAGVPAGVCVYNRAWDAIVWLGKDVSMADGGTAMRDVADAIRQHYAAAIASAKPGHQHWKGLVQLMS